MAINDFTTGSMTGEYAGKYYWYKNAYSYSIGKMSTWETDTSVNFGTGYTNTGTIIDIWNKGTRGKYNAEQDDHDIFKHIQGEYAKGWYIPSSGEWAAFADYLAHIEENPLTSNYVTGSYVENTGNYDNVYGFKTWYWSSSQDGKAIVFRITFSDGFVTIYRVDFNGYVRLGVTF